MNTDAITRFRERFYHSDTCESNKFAEQNREICMCQIRDIESFLETELDTARQEERERVVDIVSFIDEVFLTDIANEEKYPIEYAINYERRRIQLAILSLLDNPLTDKLTKK